MKPLSFRILFASALLLYAGSLGLPTFQCGDNAPFLRLPSEHDPVGIALLLTGYMGIMVGEVRWFTNIFVLLMLHSLVYTTRPRQPGYALITLVLALSCIVVPARACGNGYDPSRALGIGGYFWVAAVTLISILYLVSQAGPRHGTATVDREEADPIDK